MNIIQWLSVVLTGAVLSFGFIFHSLAAPAEQADKPLFISISTAQAEATAGKAMSWQISLTPQGRQPIRSIELRSGDQESWSWLEGDQTIPVLTNTVVLNVTAIPLVTGNLMPIIEARATVDNKAHQQVAIAENPVTVQSVETQVEAKILASQATVEKEGPLPVELWIHNSSPFTLTQVEAVGSGIDLVWDQRVTLPDIPPAKIMTQTLTPTVIGTRPQPQLSIAYTWTDDTGASHDHSFYISGETAALEESFIDKIPEQSIGLLLGVAAGVLTTLLTTFAVSELTRRRQRQANRAQVHGLLHLLIEKSDQAADNGVEVELETFENIYKQEGLSTILKEDDLTSAAHDLWKTARRYNLGLNQPGGAQRTDELRRAAQRLREKLAPKTG